jgi:hypothetical protein
MKKENLSLVDQQAVRLVRFLLPALLDATENREYKNTHVIVAALYDVLTGIIAADLGRNYIDHSVTLGLSITAIALIARVSFVEVNKIVAGLSKAKAE